MSDDMDKTASRKPVVQVHVPQQPARSVEPKQQVRTGSQPKRKARPTSSGRQDGTRGTRRRTSQQRPSSRNGRREDARLRGRPARAQHAATPKRQPRRGVPVAVFVVVLLLSIVASALITRSILMGQVREAQSQAAAAQNRATSLADQLESKNANSTTQGTGATADDATKDESNKATVSQTGLESPWIADGKFSTGDSTLDDEVKKYCDGVVDKSMELDAAALEVYKSIAWSNYVERDSAQSPSGKDWRTQFARMYYENDCSGNCYEFSTFLSYCLRYLGYADAKAEGVLVELQSGGWGDHCIVYVTNKDGSSCICDTARGTNGWMIPSTSYNVKMQDLENA